MKTIELKIYKFDELSEEAKDRAIEKYRSKGHDHGWSDEISESFKAADLIYDELKRIEGEISGGRLVAWIENNISHHWREHNRIGKHPVKYSEIVTKRRFKNGFYFSNSDYEYKYDCKNSRFSRIFQTNNLENCPLTGVCFDYDFLQPIIDFMKNPSSHVSNIDLCTEMPTLQSVSDQEYENCNTDEYISEHLSANDYDFLENGKMY